MSHRWLRRGSKFFVIAVAAVLVVSLAIMLLWNALVPDIFHGPSLTYWQAAGLLILSHLLLRSGPMHGRHGWHHEHWRKRLEDRLAGMTPEEREKFKAEWHPGCGFREHFEDTKTPDTASH